MTEVSFHFNVVDRTDYTCRLVRKAARAGAAVVLAGPPPVLAHFDRALWTFDDLEFIPHTKVLAGAVAALCAVDSQVWLVEEPSQAASHEVLINLGTEPPVGFESFEKLIEIVSTDAAERDAARQRWKHYAARGYAIAKHEVAA
jgi:DNA polymerase III subunit chi